MTVRNPFPGMNPFLEQRWKDFHGRFISALGGALNEALPDDLVARTETDLYVTADRHDRLIEPDAFVVELPDVPSAARSAPGRGTALAPKPVRIRLRSDPVKVHRVEIREAYGENRVVTAIEVFSPTNKADYKGRRQYKRKRREYLAAGINLVEIDLLRGGRHLLYAPPATFPAEVRKTYRVCVVRRPVGGAETDPGDIDCDLYGANLDESLPAVNVPLRPTDADAVLPLQGSLDFVFRQGKYIDLRYNREPEPPFDDAERAIVRERLARLSLIETPE